MCSTLSLPRSSLDDFVFSVFSSIFFHQSYKIILLKIDLLLYFSTDFHKIFKNSRLISHALEDVKFVP